MLPTLGIGAGSCRSLGYIEQKSTGKKLAKESLTNQLTTRSFQPSTLCRRTTNKKRAKNGEDIS